MTQPIGIYDSGVGGLTVLKEFMAHFPHERFVYVADTLHLPYGNKSRDQIISFADTIIQWLQDTAQVKLVLAACHTSSVLALETIRPHIDIPIIGTVYPLVTYLQTNPQHQRIGILATPASAQSRMHEKILKTNGIRREMVTVACPDFVPLIEAAQMDPVALEKAAQAYLSAFNDFNLDTLLYACTHYPLIRPFLERLLPPEVHHLNPALAMIEASHTHLSSRLHLIHDGPTVQFFATHPDTHAFRLKVQQFLGFDPGPVPHLDIHQTTSLDTAGVVAGGAA